ncbi:MAG: hypothetical protein RBS38_09400 [Bacteroidales bacterium]|jgi:hypothetical protein|nr:hypothetical protein [Bacteroidales bacterium]
MKIKTRYFISSLSVLAAFLLTISCEKKTSPALIEKGTFPDSLIILSDINSSYDDYNSDIHQLSAASSIVFSSNRGSSGGQFDLVHGAFAYSFVQESGDFFMFSEMASDPFLAQLVSKVNTAGDDFGPYRFYSPVDGFEYLVVSSENASGDLDFQYTKNLPYFGTSIPAISDSKPVTLLNSSSDDAYFCFNTGQDTAYFCRDTDGSFDIWMYPKQTEATMDEWFSQEAATPVRVDALSSTANDKCPYIFRKIIVFASDREGGQGGFDLYYSEFENGAWRAPVNFGPSINTASDEYRPILSGNEYFTNMFLLFSSNRPGGKGGFDLYFRGTDLF